MDHNEVATVGGALRLIACPTLSYEHDKIDRYVQEGPTVAAHLQEIALTTEAEAGCPVARVLKTWPR